VVAVAETLQRSTLGQWQPGQRVNLERCLRLGDRLDGHLVQGHVDARAQLQQVDVLDGSWRLVLSLPAEHAHLVVPKGSICVNGVSLTVVEAEADWCSVVIIPYTWQHTNLRTLAQGEGVNLEFDIFGKYLQRWQALRA
jgi:riboflavin synthase